MPFTCVNLKNTNECVLNRFHDGDTSDIDFPVELEDLTLADRERVLKVQKMGYSTVDANMRVL